MLAGSMSGLLERGDVIADAYVIEQTVGVGGMCVVAAASHRTERHRVAIKLLLPEVARRRDVVKRFERERLTLMRLHSDHTLRIYGAGTHRELPFMLLEYLNGIDLAELIKRDGPLQIDEAVQYVLQACHSIAEAHSLGIIHRDLKPSNLFLTRRHDGSPCIKVLDFGISKMTQPAANDREDSLVTRAHVAMGTPFYMSPEQMLSTRDADHRTDIWALGVTLYELLTKALPFAADTPDGVCKRIMGDDPTPLRRLRPHYPKGLEAIIARCLQRSPSRRFANIADLATALADFGPPHSRHAAQAIFALVEPTAPVPQTHLTANEGGDGDTRQDTTVYLPQEGGVSGGRLLATLGIALGSFALGGGVGWVMSLETDPTKSAGVAVEAPAVAPSPSPAPRPPPVIAPEPVAAEPAPEAPPVKPVSPPPLPRREPRPVTPPRKPPPEPAPPPAPQPAPDPAPAAVDPAPTSVPLAPAAKDVSFD